MGYKIKYKQQLRDAAASGSGADGDGGGGGGGGGAAPSKSPPREPAPLPPRRSPSSSRQQPAPSRRRSPSRPGVECKIPRRNDHCDPDDHSGEHGSSTNLYVGNISGVTRKQDLEAAFGGYGRLQQVNLYGGTKKYGFVVFYDPKHADAARNGLDGQEIYGSHITVQFARGNKMTQHDTRYIHDDQNDRQDGNSKLFVSKISPGTWEQDVRRLFNQYGRVRKVNLRGDIGFVEFYDSQDADDARRNLNGQEFNGNRIGVKFAYATGVSPGPVDSAQIRCYNCGTEGHMSGHCKAGDMTDRCFRCGEKGHRERNCQNSPKDIRKSHSRSLSPGHGMGQSGRRYRSCSRSYGSSDETCLNHPSSPRRGNRNAGGEELPSRGPRYSHNPRSKSSPPKGARCNPWER